MCSSDLTMTLLLSNSGGYGFLCSIENLISRNKGGKAFINLQSGESVCVPSAVGGGNGAEPLPHATHVACASTGGRILTFPLADLKAMEKGGRGLMLMDLDDKDTMAGAAAYTHAITLWGVGRGGKAREETLEIRTLNNAKGVRGRKGKVADLGFKPTHVDRKSTRLNSSH